jgi:hypothetical protein
MAAGGWQATSHTRTHAHKQVFSLAYGSVHDELNIKGGQVHVICNDMMII